MTRWIRRYTIDTMYGRKRPMGDTQQLTSAWILDIVYQINKKYERKRLVGDTLQITGLWK
jgi:hypothetical protein